MRTRDADKEHAIREHALKMIVQDGLDGLSMQKLARAAGVSPATIYIYFKDRDDLIVQLYVEANKKMADATLKNFDSEMSFREGLKIQWINRARYCMKYPDQMYFLEQLRNSPLQDKAFNLIDPTFKKAMSAFVKNAIRKDELIKVPVEVYWSIAFAPLYSLVKFHRSGTSVGGMKFSMTERILAQTFSLVLKALKP